ncbi:Protein white [Portunus trituberculatus]|uniref:Protein white n=1 Tax=Portunus trituberculatus TaxID=210409 RepID=A0A5B7DHD1_PORTR|nr:Protein white [Portunus trituberculatus]
MYRPDVYFLSKNIVHAPIFTFYSILYTSIYYFLVGLTPELDRFLICLLTGVLITWCAISFGERRIVMCVDLFVVGRTGGRGKECGKSSYFLSCLAPTINVALLLLSPFFLLYMVLSGFFLNLRSVPLFMKFISYMSWFTYGNEVLLVNQWAGVTNITCSPTATTCYPDGATILQQLNFSPEYFVRDLISLCCLTLGHLVAAYFFFHLRTLRSKPRR